jgi:hypothetical protein
MRERATERATVPHCRVGHRLGGGRDQPGVLPDQRVVQDLVVGGHGPDHQVVAVLPDTAHVTDPPDVDDHRRVGEPQPQQGNEGLAAGHDLGVVAALPESGDRLVHRARPHVVELGGDHWAPPAVASVCAPP